jgi:hypothetical protein
VHTPQKIVLQLCGSRRFETGDLHARWIDAGQQAFERAVFPAGVHRLQHDEQTALVFGVKCLLQGAQPLAQDIHALQRFFFDE